MRAIYGLGVLTSLLLVAGEAKPCGGAFGSSYTIDPAQKIVVSYHDGVETYTFNPSFCGKSDSFGLILPIPSQLSETPALISNQLYTDLADLTAPRKIYETQCSGMRSNGGGWDGVGGSASVPPGTVVIQRGQVGIFDYALLKANSVSSFTEWLTTNGFPNKAAASTFQPYVDNGWYFVAFKVSPGGTSNGTAGSTSTTTSTPASTLCGSFGPVALAFPVAGRPVIPARIASVSSSSFQWDIFAIGPQQMQLKDTATSLRFSGPIGAPEIAKYSGIARLARPGDRLTELLLTETPSSDLTLEPSTTQSDFRRTETVYQYVTCTGGTSSSGGATTQSSAGSSTGSVTLPQPAGGASDPSVNYATTLPSAGGSTSSYRTQSKSGLATSGGQGNSVNATTVVTGGSFNPGSLGQPTTPPAAMPTSEASPASDVTANDGCASNCSVGKMRERPAFTLCFLALVAALGAVRRRKPQDPRAMPFAQ